MGKSKGGENTKKASGNAKKVEAASQKAAAENAKKAVTEDVEWSKGAKSNAKKEEAEQKKQEQARKKAEKEALLAEEEKAEISNAKNASAKSAAKKNRGLDLSQIDSPESSTNPALNATGIDNALDALSLTAANPSEKVDRHPERRFKAAYAAYEARRLPELEQEQTGLRRQQRIDMIRKEFEKSPENPFNQVSAKFDSTREEVKGIKEAEREKIEQRLGEK